MTIKEFAKNVIDSLPNESSIDDIIHALYINTKFEHGKKEIENGKGISNSDAKKKLSKWQQ